MYKQLRPVLWIALCAAALGWPAAAGAGSAVPPPASGEATLSIQVSYVFRPPQRPSVPSPTRAPGDYLEVRAVPVGGGPVAASGMTDASGHVTLQLAEGDYWLFVPPVDVNGQAPPRTVGTTSLPDGTVVLQWWDRVEAPAGSSQTVDLTLDVRPT